MRFSRGGSACTGKNGQAGLFLGLILWVLWSGRIFVAPAEVDWARDAWALLGGTVALALAALHALALVAGWGPALRFLASTVAISWLAEAVGLRWDWPFGAGYHYHPDVRPVLPGGVPLFIPLAWFALASFPPMLLRGRSPARRDHGRPRLWLPSQSALAACGMVACDLALDPVAVSMGLWTWAQPGPYFGIPWLNFAGWWGVSLAIFGVGYGWMGLDQAGAGRIPLRYDLAWGAAQGVLLVLLGLGACNRIGSAWPVLLTVAVLAPLSLGWMESVYWRIRSGGSVPRRDAGS